jgi:hypothetical protein
MWHEDISYSEAQRRCKAGVYESYKPSKGRRRVIFDSVKRRREAAIAVGPQYPERPLPNGKKRGRPRKPRPDDAHVNPAE